MKRAALITDISGLGNCSGTANISILSYMGIETCIIPTAILSAQTGFSDYYIYDFTENMRKYISSLEKINPCFDAVYVGFLANKAQADIVKNFIEHFRSPDTVVITDPIMGDNGKIHGYFDDELCNRISKIVLDSNIITPNLTELCILAKGNYDFVSGLNEKEKYDEIYRLCKNISEKNVGTVIVTGIENGQESFSNLVADRKGYEIVHSKKCGGSFSGTGDIFTSIICGAVLNGQTPFEATEKASKFISGILEQSHQKISDRNYGIPYQLLLSDSML